MLSLAAAGQTQDVLRKQVMVLAPGDSATFLFTNKTTAFYYGEAGRLNSTPFQGFNVLTHEYFEDYILQFDGQMLDRRSAEAFVYPDRLVRRYPLQRVTEEVILLDSLNVLAIKVFSSIPGKLTFIPAFAGSRHGRDYEVRWEQEFSMLHVGQRALMAAGKSSNFPAWTAVSSPAAPGAINFVANETDPSGVQVAQLFGSPTYVPGCLQRALRDSAAFYVIVGGDAKELMSVRNHVDEHLERLLRARHRELENLLERQPVKIGRNDPGPPTRWTEHWPARLLSSTKGESTSGSRSIAPKQNN